MNRIPLILMCLLGINLAVIQLSIIYAGTDFFPFSISDHKTGYITGPGHRADLFLSPETVGLFSQKGAVHDGSSERLNYFDIPSNIRLKDMINYSDPGTEIELLQDPEQMRQLELLMLASSIDLSYPF